MGRRRESEVGSKERISFEVKSFFEEEEEKGGFAVEFGVMRVGLRSPPTPILMVDPPLSRTMTLEDMVADGILRGFYC